VIAKRKKTFNIFLVLLLVISVFLGAYGMSADLPYSRTAVEIAIVGMSVKLGTGDLNPHIFNYPALFMYILFFFYSLFFISGKIFGVFPNVQAFQDLYFKDATAFYVIARSVTLFFMAGSVFLTYRIAERLFNKKVATLAAVFMTFNITNVQLSHYATTDIPVLFFSLLALLFIVKIIEKNNLKTYIMAGLFVGIATAVKYQAIFLFFSILLAHFLSFEKNRNLKEMIFTRKLTLSGLACFFGFFLGSPFCILDFRSFLADFVKMGKIVSSPIYGFVTYRVDSFLPVYIVKTLLPFAMGIAMTAVSLAALIYAIKKHTKADILFLGTILIFLTYVVASNWTFLKPRHIIHLFPLFFILAGRLLYDISSMVFKEKGNFFLGFLAFLLLIPSFCHIWSYEKGIAAKPVWVKTKEWIETNIPNSSKIAIQDGIPINPNEKAVMRRLNEIEAENIGKGTKLRTMLTNRHLFSKVYDIYELPYPWRLDYDDSDFDFDYHVKEGVRYFVFTKELSNYFNEPDRYPVQLAYYDSVKENCVLVRKLESAFFRSELGDIEEDPYVLVYKYKEKIK